MTIHHLSSPPRLSTFRTLCLTEAIRLQEQSDGPLDDSAALRYARQHGTDTYAQLQLRALFLAHREKLDLAYDRWLKTARWFLLGLVLLACLAGMGGATAALGNGTQPVNLFLALLTLLGIHLASFLFWLISLSVSPTSSGGWLGRAWLWSSQVLARQPQTLLAASAAGTLLARQGSLRWWLSAVSHLIWISLFLGMIATLISLLSARFYTFMWETTLLTPDTFVTLGSAIGWLPAKLGFAVPSEAVIRVSDNQHMAGSAAQVLWSGWLIGAVVTYGLLPRLIALLACLLTLWRQQKQAAINPHLPGLVELLPRLQAQSPHQSDIDRPASPETIGNRQITTADSFKKNMHSARLSVIAALELNPSHSWPPAGLTSSQILDAGLIDTLEQRNQLLDTLAARPANHLLLICDGSQTPDRGIIHFILDLAQYAAQTHIAFICARANQTPHPAWHQRLQASGFSDSQIHWQLDNGLNWLQTAHETHTDS